MSEKIVDIVKPPDQDALTGPVGAVNKSSEVTAQVTAVVQAATQAAVTALVAEAEEKSRPVRPDVRIAIVFEIPLILGLGPKDLVMLAVTFLLSAVTLGTGRTHIMQGAVHLVVFAAFLFLAFVP